MIATGFKDKTGRMIYSGDIVMNRLGKFAKKSGGPSYYKIIVVKNVAYSCFLYNGEWTKSTRPLRQSDCTNFVITDTSEREK